MRDYDVTSEAENDLDDIAFYIARNMFPRPFVSWTPPKKPLNFSRTIQPLAPSEYFPTS
jgi:hypothetical protein